MADSAPWSPPINDGEVYVRCPECGLIGWTEDDDSKDPPQCPECLVPSVVVRDINAAEGRWDIRLIDGAPTDPTHHLTEIA